MRKRVVVTGMGCISPVGNTVKETWDAMLAHSFLCLASSRLPFVVMR